MVSKRNDGFHNLQSIFYPVSWSDVIEIHICNKTQLKTYGSCLKIKTEDNIVFKAYELLKSDFNLPAVDIRLLKNVPNGAGLGGGSANGSSTLKMLNEFFKLNLSCLKLKDYALKLGSDCPFFINKNASLVSGRGENIKTIPFSLKGYFIYIIHPSLHISTTLAFSNIVAKESEFDLQNISISDIKNWKNYVKNDFEKSVFKRYPLLKSIKEKFYENGAIYSSMTGTGSSVYGLFKEKPALMENDFIHWIGELE